MSRQNYITLWVPERNCSRGLFPEQVRHVIVVLCLEEVASDRIAQFVLLGELCNMPTTAPLPRAVVQYRFVKLDAAALSIHQEHVPVVLWKGKRQSTRPNILVFLVTNLALFIFLTPNYENDNLQTPNCSSHILHTYAQSKLQNKITYITETK